MFSAGKLISFQKYSTENPPPKKVAEGHLYSEGNMRLLFIGAVALAVGACASASKPGAMIAPVTEATIIKDDSQLRQAVAVGAVTGGKETNPLWTSQVSSEDFAEALRQSLDAHAMLAGGDGAYRLDAELQQLKQPFAGFNLKVTSTVRYTASETATGQVVFNETVTEAYTAKTGEAFLAVERLHLANEGSIKANISTMIRLLVEKLGSQAVTAPAPSDDAGDVTS